MDYIIIPYKKSKINTFLKNNKSKYKSFCMVVVPNFGLVCFGLICFALVIFGYIGFYYIVDPKKPQKP